MVIRRMSVTKHRHDIRKLDAGSVVLVRIEEDAKSLKPIRRAEHRTIDPSLLREPHGHAVTKKMMSAMNVEFHFDLLHHQLECLENFGKG